MAGSLRLILDRLTAVDQVCAQAVPDLFDGSRVALLFEYMRRAALWVEHYDYTDEWVAFDLAEVANPGHTASPEIGAELEQLLTRLPRRGTEPDSYRGMVRLAAMRDAGMALPGLPDPYEPLIALYERGGSKLIEEWDGLNVGRSTVPRRTPAHHRDREPLTDLSPAALDAVDEAEQQR